MEKSRLLDCLIRSVRDRANNWASLRSPDLSHLFTEMAATSLLLWRVTKPTLSRMPAEYSGSARNRAPSMHYSIRESLSGPG
jgi:hypothetical protein